MKIDTLIEIKEILNNNDIILSFSGFLSQTVIEELGNAIKLYLNIENTANNDISHVFSVFIEQTQNIRKYFASKPKERQTKELLSSGIILIGKIDDRFFVHSGNIIENNDVQLLKDKLDFIMKLNKDELKAFYKQQAKKELSDDSQSAGLGLIDMARKATKPITYNIVKVNENYSFYSLKIIV